MNVIACIDDPVVIKTILTHLAEKIALKASAPLPETLAPPHARLFNSRGATLTEAVVYRLAG